MNRRLRCAVSVAVLAALTSAALAVGPAPTIGDLLKRPVDVRVGEKVSADPDRARQNYEAFLALSNGDDALRAEALRRLGDLKLEAGEEERIGRDLNAGSPLATRDAIALYARLLETVPNYPRTDAVLYQLSRAYEAAGDNDNSLATLDLLVTKFPRSALAAEAQFRRGELYFSGHRWADAEAAYQTMLMNFSASEFVEQATYKLGWSRFKAGDNDGALDAFVRLLDRQLISAEGRENDLDTFSRPRRELIEDTLRVSAVIFATDDGATGVGKFLGRVGRKPYADLLYATLGDLYAAKERWTDAATAYSAFAKLDPMHERAPLLQSVAIDVYRRGGFSQLVLQAKQDYVERYGLGADFWTNRNAQEMPLVVREVKQNLQDLAAYYHEQAQASKVASDYQEAARWYREFLTEFPKDPAAADVAYLLSDALFESHQYGAAATEYLHAAYDYPAAQRSATAAYAAVVAFEKQESATTGVERLRFHQNTLEASLRFGKAFPDHPESGPVLVRTARQRLDDHEYQSALEVSELAIDRQPALASVLLRDAWIVRATAEFELAHYERSEQAGLEALKFLPVADNQRGAVEERLAASIYRQAEAQRGASAPGEAAQTFLRIGQLVPHASVREAADYDAAAAFLAAERWTDAIAVLESYRREYPKSERQAEVTRRLAAAYLAAKQPTTAAAEFERIASQSGVDAATQRDALSQAAELYEKAGERARATGVLEAYVRRFPEPFDPALEARQKLADFALTTGDQSRRLTLLEALVQAEAAAGSHRTERSRSLAAQATLELAAPLRDAFASIRLTLPLKRSLESKRSSLQKALHAYEVADSFAIADVSTAATFEMAGLYQRLGSDLMKSDRPKNLPADALEQYDLLLEEQASPFEEKAIALHEVNVARLASGVYDDAVRRSLGALAVLKPARYSKLEALEALTIDMVSGAAGSPTLERTVRFQEAVALAPTDPERAEREFKELNDQVANVAGPAFNAAVLAANAGRYLEADALLVRAEKTAPSNSTVTALHGVVLRNLGRFSDAERTYRESLAIDPNAVRTRRNLGVLLDLYLGRADEAVTEWRRAIELEGGNPTLEGWVAEVTHRNPPAQRKDSGSTE